MDRPDAVLIAGPTASGKSKLALEWAEKLGGTIVNTDSMQVYPVLEILTARPGADDLALAPHVLYAHADIAKPYSVAQWMADVEKVLSEMWSAGGVPIFTGGTGLYFRALEQGLAGIPDIPPDIRAAVRARQQEEGSEALHAALSLVDPEGAAQLRPSDGQRIARALEVITATGKPLSHFHDLPLKPSLLTDKKVQRFLIMPERAVLHERINARADWMFENGAIEEVKELNLFDLPENSTVLKAIGVSIISDYILQKISLLEAKSRLKAATRQYAKRQSTWFRGQFDDSWAAQESAAPLV